MRMLDEGSVLMLQGFDLRRSTSTIAEPPTELSN